MKIFNASPGFGPPLIDSEIDEFLNTGKLNIHLGTIDESGYPNIHPAWYIYERQSKKIYLETSKHSKKTKNIQNNKNVYFCIDEPTPPYKGVRGKCNVVIHENIEFNVPIAEKIMLKYLGTLDHPMAQALLEMQRKGQSVVLEIIPKCSVE